MRLLNATKMQAGCTLGLEPDGREHIVVAVKGTFVMRRDGEPPELAEEQLPLIEADQFRGAPGLSAPVYETDYAPRKLRCDVLLNGTAFAPRGRAAARVRVGMKVGTVAKAFDVVGDRTWGVVGASPPQPFITMPISYDNAFGGVDNFHPDAARHRTYLPNPVGRGYHEHLAPELIDGTPLPNTEEIGRPVRVPNAAYQPMAFGPVGRAWLPRYKFAGTYDQQWVDQVFPFLPADFDPTYYQAAPADQQMPYPAGGEEVVLANLVPEGRVAFRLPRIEVPVVFFPRKGGREEVRAIIDTLVFEPDRRRFTMTWRASRLLKRNMFEVLQVIVGTMPRGWWRAREVGKTYYRSLAALPRRQRSKEDSTA